MTYIVDEKCIKCKTTDCVAVCPVNCFYEGENMLVIHPDECIDCGVLRARVPGRRHQAGQRARLREVARTQPGVRAEVAEYHGKEGHADGRPHLLARDREIR